MTIQGATTATLGGTAIYTDRPTITYVPMTGEKFLRGLITPIDPKNIFFLLQSGYAADFILGMAVESLNGVRNRSTAGGAVREADPAFIRALELLREVQPAGAFGMRVEEDKAKGSTAVVFFRRDDVPPDIEAKGAEVRGLLKLPAEPQKFVLTYSPTRGEANELAVNSRSMLQIMQAFASYIDVPEAHLKDSSAWPSLESTPVAGVQPANRPDPQRQGEAGERFCRGAVPRPLVLGGQRRPGHQTRPHGGHVLFHPGRHRQSRAAAPGHHPGAVAPQKETNPANFRKITEPAGSVQAATLPDRRRQRKAINHEQPTTDRQPTPRLANGDDLCLGTAGGSGQLTRRNCNPAYGLAACSSAAGAWLFADHMRFLQACGRAHYCPGVVGGPGRRCVGVLPTGPAAWRSRTNVPGRGHRAVRLPHWSYPLFFPAGSGSFSGCLASGSGWS